MVEELRAFRSLHPERAIAAGQDRWRYRMLASAGPALLLIPGGELVNDLAFQFATAMSNASWRVIYPAYPRVSSIDDLADGLVAILDAENIDHAAILSASFGGAVAQVFVRKYPSRVSALMLSNTGVPLRWLLPAQWTVLSMVKLMPWPTLCKLLKRAFAKVLNPSDKDVPFWSAYFEELLSSRLTKADVVANIRQQVEYHQRFHFTPQDLPNWEGRVLITESDTDIIGPRRRQALRETYPQAELYTFHNAGHAPMFSRFDEYLTITKRFLNGETPAAQKNPHG